MPSRRRVLGLLVVVWALGVGAVYRYVVPPDEGPRWLRAGDVVAAGGPAPPGMPPGLTARTAYLLAFHHAQDARDVPRMRAAADRLERTGERDLAAWTREAARAVAAERATGR